MKAEDALHSILGVDYHMIMIISQREILTDFYFLLHFIFRFVNADV